MTFKAKLVDPKAEGKLGWDWCYKSSWLQKPQEHESDFLIHLQGLPNMVDLLAYGVVKIENNDDTTSFRRQCLFGKPMIIIDSFYNKAKSQHHHFTQHIGTATSSQDHLNIKLANPR